MGTGLSASDYELLFRLVEESACLPDVDSFRRTLFEHLNDSFGVSLAAFCYRGAGAVRVFQSREISEEDFRTRYTDVHAEQVGFLRELPNPAVSVISRTVPEPAVKELATYQRIWKPNGIKDGVVGATGEPCGARGMLVLLDEDGRDRRIDRLRLVLSRLLPYVGKNLDHFTYLEGLKTRISTLEEITRTAGAALLVDSSGRTVWMSAAARNLFRELTGREAAPAGILRSAMTLHHALSARNGAPPEAGSTNTLTVRDRCLCLRYKPIQSDGVRRVLVTVDDPEARRREEFARRARGFGLTPRERQIAFLVVGGRLNKEIARKLGVTLQTVKNHIKGAFARTGARNRAELVQLFLDDPASS